MAHSFIELDKPVVHAISLISFLWLWFSVCQPYFWAPESLQMVIATMELNEAYSLEEKL